MTQFVVIRGKCSSGKTTTCWLVYRSLLRHIDAGSFVTLTYRRRKKTYPAAEAPQMPESDRKDFKAILTVDGKRICIASEGDTLKVLRHSIEEYCSSEIDYFLCCTHSQNRKNSPYRYVLEEIEPNYPVKYYSTCKPANKTEWTKCEQNLANEIVEYILSNGQEK